MDEQHRAAFEAAKQLPPELVNDRLQLISQALTEEKAYGVLQDLSAEQLIKRFASYGFRDSLGHPLEHCQDFLTLIAMVKTESQVNECS